MIFFLLFYLSLVLSLVAIVALVRTLLRLSKLSKSNQRYLLTILLAATVATAALWTSWSNKEEAELEAAEKVRLQEIGAQFSSDEIRFLTEAEWEYVARAGTATAFHTGSTISADQAHYDRSPSYGTMPVVPSERTRGACTTFTGTSTGPSDAVQGVISNPGCRISLPATGSRPASGLSTTIAK